MMFNEGESNNAIAMDNDSSSSETTEQRFCRESSHLIFVLHPFARPAHPTERYDVSADCLKACSGHMHGDMRTIATFFGTGENRSMILALGVTAVIMCRSYFNSVVCVSMFRTSAKLRCCPGCKHLKVPVCAACCCSFRQ